MGNPGQITEAGRIAFTFDPDYLDGTLFMALPSGRLLSYPGLKWRTVAVLDDKGRETGEFRDEVSSGVVAQAAAVSGHACENVSRQLPLIFFAACLSVWKTIPLTGCRSEATPR